MHKITSAFFMTVMLFGFEPAHATDKPGALPAKVISAKTIYLDNQTNDAEIQHDAYMGIGKWGRYEIVDSAQKADLVLRFTGSSVVKFVPGGDPAATYEPKPVSESSAQGEELAPPGFTRLSVIDAKTGATLWSDLRKTSNSQEKGKLMDGLHDAVDRQEKAHHK